MQITLFRGWLDPGNYVWSPFVTKIEFHFRQANVKYILDGGSPRSAPKGKIPYISVHDEGSSPFLIADSALIIAGLVESDILPDLNSSLEPAAKAQDMAIRALLEDKLYFYGIRERWMDNYYTQRDKVLGSVPYPMRVLVGILAYRQMKATLYGQGTGRFTSEEIMVFRKEIWQSLDGLLETSRKPTLDVAPAKKDPFWCLGGEQPTEADASLFGFIISILVSTSVPVSRELVRSLPAVMDYVERIHYRYFPDYEKWIDE
ncbi:putative failed axon connections [Botrytis fragariae]|uniref:Putative failed axon connections n=1 Tax=Botrytis fragariae TaxID=1964551 RepID=A0A8H6EJ71_9HELO|nr:putative failed axon connections [Botrytis fragariae]KAF5874214.1 putative failed axon connections [Botrytis fragariae]